MIEILSSLGFAILACATWVIVSGFLSNLLHRLEKYWKSLADSRTEEEWAWIALPIGGGILLLVAILKLDLSVMATNDDCIIVREQETRVIGLPTSFCEAVSPDQFE